MKIEITMEYYEALRIRQALYHMVGEFRDEMNSPETSEGRREICDKSVRMWNEIYNKVCDQIESCEEK